MDNRFKKAFITSVAGHLSLIVYSMFFLKEIDNETIYIEIQNKEINKFEHEEVITHEKTQERKNLKYKNSKNERKNSISDFLTGFKKAAKSNDPEKEDFGEKELIEKKRSIYKQAEKKSGSEFLEQKNDVIKEKKFIINEEKKNTVWKSGNLKREIIFDPPLHFPSSIKNIGVSARVKVKAFVDPDGRVFGVEFIEKSGFSGLDLSVSKHIRSMRFGRIEKNENSEFSREYIFRLKSNSE